MQNACEQTLAAPRAQGASDRRDDLNALLKRAGGGDKEAFRELYRETAPRLYSLCLGMLRDHALAEEALQEGFLDAWRGARTFRPERGHALGWLSTVTRNRAIQILKRRARAGEAAAQGDPLLDEQGETIDPLARLSELESGRALELCLGRLSEHERNVILMAFYEGLSHAGIAQRVERPVGTVKSWIRRGLGRMRRCLDEAS
ncbi:sigma-70 family RNA polymerase sigma factor [Ferruginivarius sediminum]|nr:sigma-70 family RNA polymerase sigma factor [Ferruginivarius sediminum]